MMLPEISHPLELRFSAPFDYATRRVGALGLHGNAFLSGAFDDVDLGNHWYDHPACLWSYHFRREDSFRLEAEWIGDWFCLLRHEGASALRLHWERCGSVTQHRLFNVPAPDQHLVISAWSHAWRGARCQSSWTPVIEDSAARVAMRASPDQFPQPVGIPAEQTVHIMLRTTRLLDGAREPAGTVASLAAGMDDLVARARACGYVMRAIPSYSAERVAWALAQFAASAPTDAYHPFPLFANDRRADGVRQLYIDAGLLAAQLEQLPQTPRRHPYDDDAGPIFPAADHDGSVYRALRAELDALGLRWMAECFRSWDGSPDQAPESRLNLRSPIDLAVSRDGVESFIASRQSLND